MARSDSPKVKTLLCGEDGCCFARGHDGPHNDGDSSWPNPDRTIPPQEEIKDHAALWKYSDAVHRLHGTKLLSAEEEAAGKAATAEYDRIAAFIDSLVRANAALRGHHNERCPCGTLV